jgi:hypothetical protein
LRRGACLCHTLIVRKEAASLSRRIAGINPYLVRTECSLESSGFRLTNNAGGFNLILDKQSEGMAR